MDRVRIESNPEWYKKSHPDIKILDENSLCGYVVVEADIGDIVKMETQEISDIYDKWGEIYHLIVHKTPGEKTKSGVEYDYSVYAFQYHG